MKIALNCNEFYCIFHLCENRNFLKFKAKSQGIAKKFQTLVFFEIYTTPRNLVVSFPERKRPESGMRAALGGNSGPANQSSSNGSGFRCGCIRSAPRLAGACWVGVLIGYDRLTRSVLKMLLTSATWAEKRLFDLLRDCGSICFQKYPGYFQKCPRPAVIRRNV